MLSAAIALGCSFVSVITFYPYRDYVRYVRRPVVPPDMQFVKTRIWGMLSHPTQPLLLSLPTGALYAGYCGMDGGLSGIAVGGLAHSVCKTFVSVYAGRISSQWDGRFAYSTPFRCFREATATFGFFSWFAGALSLALPRAVWHGGTLFVLGRDQRPANFLDDWFRALRTHALFALISSPLRCTLKPPTVVRDQRGMQMRNLSSYVSYELGVFREAAAVLPRLVRDEGPLVLFRGTIRAVFKTSVPWSCTYALYRFCGGKLPSTPGGSHKRRSRLWHPYGVFHRFRSF